MDSERSTARIVRLVLGGTAFRATIVDTEPGRKRGLSGHPGLAPDEAMLFCWEEAAPRRLHMREMLFPIDMIFVSESESILNLVERAPPSSDYPGPRYHSEGDARWIVECPAGTVRARGLGPGMRLEIRSALAAMDVASESR